VTDPTTLDSPLEAAKLPRLLLVEDDRALAPLLTEVLSEHHDVDHAPDGQAGLHLALTRQYDVMVIDRGLPAIEGIDLIRRLRGRGIGTPILVLTARGTVADRVEGLDAGAEDYVVKPFEIDELLARLRALLRRHSDTAAAISLGVRRLDVAGRRVVGGASDPVELSGKEAELLEMFARRPNKVFTRPELLAAVFDPQDGQGTVDTYVYYLRRKLGRDVVRTVHGLGYRLGVG
jgi:two-component system, OmpR family, response regulator QseB